MFPVHPHLYLRLLKLQLKLGTGFNVCSIVDIVCAGRGIFLFWRHTFSYVIHASLKFEIILKEPPCESHDRVGYIPEELRVFAIEVVPPEV